MPPEENPAVEPTQPAAEPAAEPTTPAASDPATPDDGTNNSLLAGADPAVSGESDGGEPPAENPDKLDFVQDRYRAEGRTEQEAAIEQAKGYAELRKKLGAFTGAPEEYEYKLSDELTEQGAFISDDDPLLSQAKEMAKEMGMSQEGFNQMVDMYVQGQLAELKVLEGQKEEQMKALGPTAGQRLGGISKFINANFDAEVVSAIEGMVTTAESVMAIEALIQATRGAPVAAGTAQAPAGVTEAEVKEMLFAEDDNGNRRINTDAEYRKEYMRKRDQLWGTAEHREQIGG